MGFIQPLRPSLQFSHSIVSNSLRPHGLQHTRPPCLSPIPSFLKLMSIKSVMPSNHLNLCHPLLLPPSIFPSIRVFPKESVLHIMWPKYWNFRFSISPSNEYSGPISFRMEWLDLLAVQRTLKSLLQHHSSNASVLWCSAFFIVQLSHPYMTTGETIALTRWTFVGKDLLWVPKGRFKRMLTRERRGYRDREEQSRNNSGTLGQSPGSPSRDTHSNIFELFCRNWNSGQVGEINGMMPTSTYTPNQLEQEGWRCWLPLTLPPTIRRMSMSWSHL